MTTIAMAKVRDLNAIDAPRTHELIEPDGKIVAYTFPPRQHIEVPLTTATRWLVGNVGFEVLGPDGQVLTLIPPPQDTGGRGLVLRPDQVIASLDELTIDALIARAQAKGGKFTKADGKKAVVEFLVSGGAPERAESLDDAPAGEPLGTLVKVA